MPSIEKTAYPAPRSLVEVERKIGYLACKKIGNTHGMVTFEINAYTPSLSFFRRQSLEIALCAKCLRILAGFQVKDVKSAIDRKNSFLAADLPGGMRVPDLPWQSANCLNRDWH